MEGRNAKGNLENHPISETFIHEMRISRATTGRFCYDDRHEFNGIETRKESYTMDTIIIGQGYNLKENTSVAKELIKLFNSKRYDSFTCLVAFASFGGVSALSKYISEGKSRGMKIKIILGIDQRGTSKEALEEVLSWGVDARIYHADSRNIFHPKVYLFENKDIFSLIVGSNNLTVPGLVQNVECSILIKDILTNPVHKDFYHYWKSILSGSDDNLYSISRKLINRLAKEGFLSSECERVNRFDDGNDKSVKTSGRSLFKRTHIQTLPSGFIPRRQLAVKERTKKHTGKLPQGKALYAGEEVLIAEIGGGPRWKQVNFPVDIFENFFGAKRGDNSYQINLLNIDKDGSLGEVETRQAVSVRSRNYRFEINCTETSGQYPGEDNRPIGLFVKIGAREFVYQVLLSEDSRYANIKEFLYANSSSAARELKRAIVHVEAIHALYPELVV